MKNIALTGFMGTGKTTVGKILSNELGFDFIDTDEYIVIQAGKSIKDIFEQNGEEYFRKLESDCIVKVCAFTNHIISTGGGSVLFAQNMKALRNNGVIVYLDASFETIKGRNGIENGRPLMSGKTEQQIETLYKSRKAYYLDNDFLVNVDDLTPDEVAGRILQWYKTTIYNNLT